MLTKQQIIDFLVLKAGSLTSRIQPAGKYPWLNLEDLDKLEKILEQIIPEQEE